MFLNAGFCLTAAPSLCLCTECLVIDGCFQCGYHFACFATIGVTSLPLPCFNLLGIKAVCVHLEGPPKMPGQLRFLLYRRQSIIVRGLPAWDLNEIRCL